MANERIASDVSRSLFCVRSQRLQSRQFELTVFASIDLGGADPWQYTKDLAATLPYAKFVVILTALMWNNAL